MLPLEDRIKEQARRLGFELAGIAAPSEAETFAHYQGWLQGGFAGEMSYLERHAEARRHPEAVFAPVRSIVVVGMNYKPAGPEDDAPPLTGKVARYARGIDYHEVLWRRLDELLAWIQEQVPRCQGRGVVDTAPLLERDIARRAGLGWFGKNAMLIHKHLGSYFFLGALLLDLALRPDSPHETQHCGTCTACLDACPTNAFTGPWNLDARRCISYLTIELRGAIPEELREPMGDWVFGCDICQEVCPWNRKAPDSAEPTFQQALPSGRVELIALLEMSEAEFRRRYRHTALWRPRWSGMRRNAAIALGNLGDIAALSALERAATDTDIVVREAALWAIGQLRLSGCAGISVETT
ncbi:MAG TPA: tRNA epoxyqueuosine(34) reductase QueG [Gemmataceae bacterium]|nr:tRNA epoxyqueuosine(34) reductase QueG [Gemmataceae bacterium]